jgi:two-component system, LytTR family, response regulator
MDVIRVVIVDDEQLSIDKIKHHLNKNERIEIIGEYRDGESAVQGVMLHKPDLLFLDIQMPRMNGFDVLKELAGEGLPAIIFVTAYDSYAVQAFDIHAVDYLLKPFDQDRFDKAINRSLEFLRHKNTDQLLQKRLAELLHEVHPDTKYVQKFVIKSRGRIYFLKTPEIDWIEAAGNYVKFHTGNDTHMIRMSMNSIEEKLDPQQFQRIHRSTIVCLDRIKEIRPWFNGEHIIVLHNGSQLSLSRGYRHKLKEVF